jgi:hypothetical protein
MLRVDRVVRISRTISLLTDRAFVNKLPLNRCFAGVHQFGQFVVTNGLRLRDKQLHNDAETPYVELRTSQAIGDS